MNIILTLMIFLGFLGIVDIYCAIASSEVNINDNITEKAYSNDINLTCSFTLLQGYDFFSIALKASQNATPGNFEEIAGYLRNYKPEFTSFGMELFGNETSFIHFDESKNTFVLSFDNLTCRHERRYKCVLYVIRRPSVTPILVESHTMWISVTGRKSALIAWTNEISTWTKWLPLEKRLGRDGFIESTTFELRNNEANVCSFVLPAKPNMNIPAKANDLPKSKRNTQSVTLPQTNDTHGMCFIEGDNITFMCEGDVGRPKGRFVWQKIYSSERKFYYPNISTETIPESCSYEGNSTLTIQVTGDDNQARIRCIVKSELPNGTKHVDSEPLLIHFKVRRPFIELFPNKTVFQEGDSVQLNCKANGNPIPTYSWTKENSSRGVIVDNDTLVINKANISDSGLYTCDTRNSIDGTEYFESMSTYIKIENISTTPSSATINPSGTDNTEVEFFASIFGTVAFLIIGICIGICVHRIKNNKSNKLIEINDSNMIVCYPTSSKSRQGNYDSVLDGDSPVETSKSNGCDHDEIEIEINKESMFNQKKGDENINTLSIQMEGYVYASVGSPKNKQTAENKKSANQQEDDLYDESKEGIYDTSGNRRHKEIHTAGNYYSTDHLKKEDSKSGLDMDLIDPQKAGGRKPSTNVTNNTLGNAGYEDVDLDNTGMKFKPQNNEETIDKVNQQNDEHFKKQKEDTDKGEDNSTTPFESAVYSLVSKLKNKQTTENKSPDDQQEDNLYEESKKGIDETSGDKENHAADHDTTDTSEHIEKQQTIGDLESSIKSNQTGSYINPVLELEEVGPCSPPLRSFGGIHDGRQINRNSEQQ